MLREKTAILAQLKRLRAADPARRARLVAAGLGSAVGMAAAVAVAPSMGEAPFRKVLVMEAARPAAADVLPDSGAPFIREDRVRRGESFAAALHRLGVNEPVVLRQASGAAVQRSLKGTFTPNAVITVASTRAGQLMSVSILGTDTDSCLFADVTDGELKIRPKPVELDARVHMQGGTIQTSIFSAMDEAGLPDSVAEELARMFGDDIDFHTDLRRGDRFSVIYEVLYYQGRAIRTGRILAAEFVNRGVRHASYLFTHPDGRQEYFNQQGRSRKEGFLRSPLEFSRVTSGFEMRLHPILNTWREHKGVDYAAPTGTAVMATADGSVEFVGRQGGYGNFVILRHGAHYSTAYGHLSTFAAGIRIGAKVSQGETIGYVGSTGWATGPHLHYEFRIDNVHQDPLTVSLPGTGMLQGSALQAFRVQTRSLATQLNMAQRTTTVLLD